MYWIAFTLGFFGSLHCIGMCGPLALAMHSTKRVTGVFALLDTLSYNTGRTIGYILLGIIAGIFGSVATLGGAQRYISIALGLILILFFLFSINPDQFINRQPVFHQIYTFISKKMQLLISKSQQVPSMILGFINGFLPCGMVYIALVGAMSLGNIWGSMGFMLFFGLGTFPAMIGITLGHRFFSHKLRISFKKLYPIISLIMGIYLVYRGLMSRLPIELDFFEALHHPVMCH